MALGDILAGMAQSHIHGRFVLKTWNFVTSAVVFRGSCGTNCSSTVVLRAGASLMAVGDIIRPRLQGYSARDVAPLLARTVALG